MGRELLEAVRNRFTDEERRLADLRAEGRSWVEVAALVGGHPDALRFKLTRGLDRVTAAMTQDRRLGAAYLPVRRPVQIDLGVLKGPRLDLEWFEPATGRRGSGGVLEARGTILLAPPFDEDSMLTLTSIG